MTHPNLPPDDSALRRFLLGQLPPDECERIADYLDRHPELASTLNALRADDTLVSALRIAPAAAPDSPELTCLISRLTSLTAAHPSTPPDGEILTISSPAVPIDSAHPPTAAQNEADPEAAFDPAAMLEPPQQPGELGRLGTYRVLGVLGRGGMGVVFEAEDAKLGRKVAIKAMLPRVGANPKAKQRFLVEARNAATVEHDYIIPIYHVGEAGGVPFLAMPLLVGESLDARLRLGQPLEVGEILTVGRQVAEGLAAAHATGLIHRDVKPSNIWLECQPGGAFKRARLFDFGLAKAISGQGEALTRDGAILGTPAFMAPEQARGLAVDARADVFSLGCVLYQMATGRRAFPGTDTFAVLTAIAVDHPPPAITVNPALPPALSNLIGRMLAKDAAVRPPSTQAVADELARIETDLAESPVTRTGSVTELDVPAPRPKSPRRWLVPAAAVLLALAGLAVVYWQTIIRIVTDKGELVVEVDDPDIEVVVRRGDAVIIDKTAKREFVIQAGKGEVEFYDPATGAKAVTRAFELTRGKTVRVSARMADLAAARPAPPVQPVFPAGDALPPKNLFPGELIAYETFDDPKASKARLGKVGGSLSTIAGGLYTTAAPTARPGDFLVRTFGGPAEGIAVATRMRVTNGVTFLSFRGRRGDERGSWLHLWFYPDGRGILYRITERKVAGDWVSDPGRAIWESARPIPGLANGNWATVAVRSAGPTTEVWVNGESVARATETPEPAAEWPPNPTAVWVGSVVTVAGPAAVDLDYVAVWKLPTLDTPAMPTGDTPPPKNLFPGELIAYETFDDPAAKLAGVANAPPSVAGGTLTVAGEHSAPPKTPTYRVHQTGPDVAFVVRLRGADCFRSVSFRDRQGENRWTWLVLEVTPTGLWRLGWTANARKADGTWTPESRGLLAKADSPAQELIGNGWVTLAGRTSGDEYEIWVNGRSVARGRVTDLGEPPGGKCTLGVAAFALRQPDGPLAFDLDYFAVWKLPAKPQLTAHEQELLDLVNKERAAAKLPPLVPDPKLTTAARRHADDMARWNKLTHESEDMTLPERCKAVGYEFGALGENVAWNQKTLGEVVQGWMVSEGHRANLLGPKYTHVGFGHARAADGSTYTAAIFTAPAKK